MRSYVRDGRKPKELLISFLFLGSLGIGVSGMTESLSMYLGVVYSFILLIKLAKFSFI